ncbi:UbiA family prenyltransferase, partial [Candidatus Liberibacter sp.]|uniref:UbiA family prenyltransferase n=1 Tax=Candidatus Liberibacter sp. TaxID=34022 RepID=UPI0015F7637A|nr:UbiA family prenyltransferase [Candidatus Liberibacter sp.]
MVDRRIGLRSRFKDFFRLLKPGVMSLAVYTALVGIVMAPGSIGIFEALVSIFAIAIGAGGSAALNMYYDADIDQIMVRTASRPI